MSREELNQKETKKQAEEGGKERGGSFRKSFVGFEFDDLNRDEFLSKLNEFLEEPRPHVIAVLNANKIYLQKNNSELRAFLKSSDLILHENALNLAFFIKKRKLKQWNMGGLPMMKLSLEFAASTGHSVFFLGAEPEVIAKMVLKLSSTYPKLKVAGWHHGFASGKEEAAIVEKINQSQAHFLFIGLGSPRQELWMARNLPRLRVKIMMGVGGSFKVLAGVEKEAPRWAKFGLEWFYRSLSDPAKITRYLRVNTFFLWLLFRFLINNRK